MQLITIFYFKFSISNLAGIFQNTEICSNRDSTFEPIGLKNGGFNCFVNAVLQSLFACSPFRNFIMSIPHTRSRTNEQLREYLQAPTVVELCKLMTEISTQRSSTDAFSIYKIWTTHCGRTNAYEDAMEFLDFIIDKVDHEMLTVNYKLDPNDEKPFSTRFFYVFYTPGIGTRKSKRE